MKLVSQAAPEIWEQKEGFVGMCEHISRCAAICYDSEPKTGGSAVDFVRNLIKRNHGRPLEFGAVYDTEPIREDFHRCHGRYDKVVYVKDDEDKYITSNLRYKIESLNSLDIIEKQWKEPEKHHEIPITVHYPIIDRAIADEFRTHTTLSTLMRSTRYVNAITDDGIIFVKPYWFDNADQKQQREFTLTLLTVEAAYERLRFSGMVRQSARSILPLCIATEMLQCGFYKDKNEGWRNFIIQRTGNGAHPDAVSLANQVEEAIKNHEKNHADR